MKKIITYEVNATAPRLSDEEVDPLEADDNDGASQIESSEGWVPWDADDLITIQEIINKKLPAKERSVIEAFLAGQKFRDIHVSEKFWRYHFARAIEMIQRELGL